MLEHKGIAASEITPEVLYLGRREFIRDSLGFAATSTGVGATLLWLMRGLRTTPRENLANSGTTPDQNALTIARRTDYSSGEANTPYQSVTTYNNFYEFGTDKTDPAQNADSLKPRPWTVSIEGEVARPQTIDVEQLVRRFPLEERIYRMRCVEAWSMVIPWVGFPLGDLL